MNSSQVMTILSEIEATSSKNDKIALLKQHGENPIFKSLVLAGLNPMVTYGVQKITHRVGFGAEDFSLETNDLLERLVSRDLTGNDALDEISNMLSKLNEQSGELLKRIITKKLDGGFGASSCNKAIKKWVPEFPYMRCSLINKVDVANDFDWVRGVFSQEKADGMFANVNHEDNGIVQISSRQGSLFPLEAFEEFMEEVRTRTEPNTQTHGEFVVQKDGVNLPREKSNGVMNHILSGGSFKEGETLTFRAWDSIPLVYVEPKGSYNVEYETRFNDLKALIKSTEGKIISFISTRVINSVEEAYAHYFEMLAQGKEGTVIKDMSLIWKDHTSKKQIKMKLEVDVDLLVTGYNEGKGKNKKTFGSLITQTSDGLLEVSISGFSDKVRKEIWEDMCNVVGTLVVVRGNNIQPPSKSNAKYSIFTPRFVEFRDDKPEADSLQQVKDQFDAAIHPPEKV